MSAVMSGDQHHTVLTRLYWWKLVQSSWKQLACILNPLYC